MSRTRPVTHKKTSLRFVPNLSRTRPVTQCGKIHPSIPPAIHPSIIIITKINFYRERFDFAENQQFDSFSVIFHSFSCRGAAHDVLSSLAENQQIRLLLCDFSLLILSRGGPRRVFVTKTIKEALKNPVAGRGPRRANSRPVLGTHDQFMIY